MPYVPENRRKVLDPHLNKLGENLTTQGDIAYCIYRLAKWGVKSDDSVLHTYAGLAQMIGVLETTKLELQRQIVEPYEDEKSRTNGPVA